MLSLMLFALLRIISLSFLSLVLLCLSLCVRNLSSSYLTRKKEGYNYIYYVHDGRKDERGFYLNSYILTFSTVRHVSDIKSQNYFQIDDKFSDLIDFLEPDFWYAYCLKNDRILDE